MAPWTSTGLFHESGQKGVRQDIQELTIGRYIPHLVT